MDEVAKTRQLFWILGINWGLIVGALLFQIVGVHLAVATIVGLLIWRLLYVGLLAMTAE